MSDKTFAFDAYLWDRRSKCEQIAMEEDTAAILSRYKGERT